MPADDGPDDWQRISVAVDLERREVDEPGDRGRKVDIVVPVEPIEPVALPPVEVSDVADRASSRCRSTSTRSACRCS